MTRDATKRCSLAFLAAGLTFAALITSGAAQAADRKVLGEQFTATWCGPCANVRQASSMLIDNYPDDVVMLQIHVWQDGYDFPWTNARATFYGVTGIPDVWFDGLVNHHGSHGTVQANYNSLQSKLLQRLTVPTTVSIEMYGEEVSGKIYNIIAKVTQEPGAPSGGAKIYMLPILDHYPVMAYYRNCPMQAAHEESFLLLAGETVTIEHQFTFDSYSWAHQNDIRIACWVTRAEPGPTEVWNAEMMFWPFPEPSNCPADINGDGEVNVLDLNELLVAWGATGGPQDINGDGIVNVLDLLAVLAAWGPCP